MTKIHNPPHPGETSREDVLPALGLTVTDAAEQLGVTRAPTLANSASLPCTAPRLSQLNGMNSSPILDL